MCDKLTENAWSLQIAVLLTDAEWRHYLVPDQGQSLVTGKDREIWQETLKANYKRTKEIIHVKS